MLSFAISLFILLHGLVHLWYFTLSQQLVPFQPAMGWSGKSWVFSNFLGDPTTRSLASMLYVLATVAFVVSGVGILGRASWWPTLLVASAVLSAITIILSWDGNKQLLLEKGLIGLLIDTAILIAMLLIRQPTTE